MSCLHCITHYYLYLTFNLTLSSSSDVHMIISPYHQYQLCSYNRLHHSRNSLATHVAGCRTRCNICKQRHNKHQHLSMEPFPWPPGPVRDYCFNADSLVQVIRNVCPMSRQVCNKVFTYRGWSSLPGFQLKPVSFKT